MYLLNPKFQQILASFCGWPGWFETNQVDHSRKHIFAWRGPYKMYMYELDKPKNIKIAQETAVVVPVWRP